MTRQAQLNNSVSRNATKFPRYSERSEESNNINIIKTKLFTFDNLKWDLLGNYGFTLAEVLITIGIIGIVAALTIPTLRASYSKKVTETRLKLAYSQLQQAVRLSEVENGEFKNWDFIESTRLLTTKKLMEKYLIPYFKNINFCSEGYTDECGFPVSQAGMNYVLDNGTSVSIVSHQEQHAYVIVDVNGKQKPNIHGKDAFFFTISEKGILPYGWDDKLTRKEIIDGIYDPSIGEITACKKPIEENPVPDSSSYSRCTQLIMYDGWKIKDDYPHKF